MATRIFEKIRGSQIYLSLGLYLTDMVTQVIGYDSSGQVTITNSAGNTLSLSKAGTYSPNVRWIGAPAESNDFNVGTDTGSSTAKRWHVYAHNGSTSLFSLNQTGASIFSADTTHQFGTGAASANTLVSVVSKTGQSAVLKLTSGTGIVQLYSSDGAFSIDDGVTANKYASCTTAGLWTFPNGMQINAVRAEPNLQRFSAASSGNQTALSNAAVTKVNFDTALYNVGSLYDATNKLFRPSNGSIWQIDAGVLFYNTTPTNGMLGYRVQIYKNGGLYANLQANSVTAATNFQECAVSGSTTLVGNGTDYYEVFVKGTTADGGSWVIDANSGYTYFRGVRLG